MTDFTKTDPALRNARERLRRSRHALMEQMRQMGAFEQGWAAQDAQAGAARGRGGASLWQWLLQAWQDHPAHWLIQTAQPLVGAYARSHPWQLVALSGLAGAALVMLRPWRMLPASALLISAVRALPLSRLLAMWRAQARKQGSGQAGNAPGAS